MTRQVQPHRTLSSTVIPLSSSQTVCPAFTRWMQRRVFKEPLLSCKAARRTESRTPLSDEEIHVAALQDLRTLLTCRSPFLSAFLEQLQQDPLVTSAWLSPLRRPETRLHARLHASGSSAARSASDASGHIQASVWVRPIDDIWAAAKQTARDASIAHHERELAFVAMLVVPLMDDRIFRFGFTHEDLGVLERIKSARRACCPEDAGQEAALHAQVALLKSLLVPDLIDFDAENLCLLQRHRICHAMDSALNVLRMNWNEPEPIKPLNRTCLMPRRTGAKTKGEKS